MKFTKDEKALLEFAMMYADKWHTFSTDTKTLKAVHGIARKIDQFFVDARTSQFRYSRKKHPYRT